MEIVDFNGEKLYKWKVGASNFIANPKRGARLMNWFLQMADGSVRDILYWPDNADMGKGFPHERGGNPILFPFCGRNHLDGEIRKWETPEGEILDMENHGYARQGEFEIVDTTDYAFIAKFIPSEEAKKAYPYQYDFFVKYRFNEFSLACELELVNKDNKIIPWSAGHHFYFKMPWHDNAKRKDYQISCDAKKAFRLDEQGKLVPTEANFPANFSDPEICNRINCKLKTNTIKFGPKNGEEDITMRIGNFDKPDAWTSLVTWTENDNSPFYCIEPWMGPPNSGEHKSGLHLVKPNSSQNFLVEISIF